MSEPENTHEDIARRLRETGIVEAPERLRADVMAQVRAEPRGGRRRFRRPAAFLRPLVPYAAAACLIGAAVIALAHAGGGSSSPSAVGGGASVAAPPLGTTKTASGAATQYEDISRKAVAAFATNEALTPESSAGEALDRAMLSHLSADQHRIVLVVPRAKLAYYETRLSALQHSGHGHGLTVVLRPRR